MLKQGVRCTTGVALEQCHAASEKMVQRYSTSAHIDFFRARIGASPAAPSVFLGALAAVCLSVS